MKKGIKIKTFKKKYWSIKFFISLIIACMIISFIISYILQLKGHSFLPSVFLNVFGGLFTGLIILLYQFYSKLKLGEAKQIVVKLQSLSEIPTKDINILDFCTDETRPSEEELEEGVVKIDSIIDDNKGTVLALRKYMEIIQQINEELTNIISFNDNVLNICNELHAYKNSVNKVLDYFEEYTIEQALIPNPYLLREIETGYVVDVFEEIPENFQCTGKDLYIDPPYKEFREVELVYKNKKNIESKEVYEEWTQKMKKLMKDTKNINIKLMNEKEKIINYHNSSIIIN
ncbi:hypothetical protein FDB53_05760 [Clostridium botulinum]|nr:hypothetical protein [Clostridium botulinum]